MASVHPVILAGGSGTRLWPLSRKASPKQFLPLLSRKTLFEETIARVHAPEFHTPLVVGSIRHRKYLQHQAPDCRILLEPTGRDSGPAIAAAALEIAREDEDGVMLVLPADHNIGQLAMFHELALEAASTAMDRFLVTFGIRPTAPETGYGYIRAAEEISSGSARRVAQFVEKPNAKTARSYLESGEYLWNSGMFCFKASDFLVEMGKHASDMLDQVKNAHELATRRDDMVLLDRNVFKRVPSLSVDYAVMEKTDRAAVLPAEFSWNDVGSWTAISDLAPIDDDRNTILGEEVELVDCKGCYVRSEGPTVGVIGLENVVVVVTDDGVLVAPTARAQEVKKVVGRISRAK